jgi:Rrf2 family protein
VLCLSQTTGYAILALACLDEVSGRWVKAREIGEWTGVPMPYLSKLLHRLGQAGIIVAKRGTFGGYTLATPSVEINLIDVAEAVEGGSWLPKCLLGLTGCSDGRACPTHDFWSRERARIEAKLSKISVKDVARFEQRRRNGHEPRRDPSGTPRGRRMKRPATARSGPRTGMGHSA